MTPSATAVVPFGAPSATTTRTYTATVPAGTVVDIQLFNSANVTVAASGAVTFADATGTANVADYGTVSPATIAMVNGVVNATGAVANGITSTGTITFSVTSTGTASVLPVLFDATGNNVLDLVVPATPNALPKAPSEAFGIGGAITFVPAQAGLGSSTPTIDTVDTTANYFTDAATYNWDANDTFQFGGVAVTQAQFESVLNTGDVLAVAYNPSAAGVSVFNVTTDTVKTPGNPTGVASNINGGTTANDVKVTFAPNADAASGDTYTLYGSNDAGATWNLVTGTTQAAGTTAGTITFTKLDVATGNWIYAVRASSALGAVFASGGASASVTVPFVAVAPKSAYFADKNGVGLANTLDAGDTVKVAFTDAIVLPAAGSTVQVSDTDGTVVNLVNGAAAAFTLNTVDELVGGTTYAAGKVLTIAVTTTPVPLALGTTAGLQLHASTTLVVDSSGIKDSVGNAWNIGGSTDKTLNLVTDFTVA